MVVIINYWERVEPISLCLNNEAKSRMLILLKISLRFGSTVCKTKKSNNKILVLAIDVFGDRRRNRS